MSATHFFTAYEVQADGQTPAIPAFFIESTAPNNFDDKGEALPAPDHCVDLGDPRQAIERIAETLARQDAPKLVITVHGFNSPRDAVLNTYAQSFQSVNGDKALHDRGVVCVGYRWPSERMGTPWRSGFAASPIFLLLTLCAALASVYFVNFVLELCEVARIVRMLITAVTAFMAVIPITLYLLRLIVYFRDGYRATTYGVPDLVDIIRLLDDALAKQQTQMGKTKVRADLSFIGHSMGGYVVTNVVRILTDVFSPAAMTAMKAMTAGENVLGTHADDIERSYIGKAFRLRRLVLVSPDIPAEVLLSGRANALRSSLIRFQEAHLFSNEGDEVLLDISTTANFFSLPTKQRKFGFRLGNVGVLTEWGITKGVSLDKLRVGSQTLSQLYAALDAAQTEDGFAQRLTYFDCTDSIENGEGVVTNARRGESCDLSTAGHLRLLWLYVTQGRPDVHSGYFAPGFVGQLIYRFACIGYGDSEQAYGQFDAFSAECKAHQVKALRS
jgi:pimeloyl-ACP methyl ester carboxylesterase